jgi:L-lactate dehydrogenase (cytochrome)
MLETFHNIVSIRTAAKKRLPRPIFDYMDGGAEDEISLRRASSDFDSVAFLPKVLADVSVMRRSLRLFGRDIPAPLMISPTGLSGLYHPDGEAAGARAAGKTGIPYSLSTLGTKSIEEVSANDDGPKLLQIYVFKDRSITANLIERARSAGFDGLIVTVDTPLAGKRERDIVNGMSVPPKLSLSSLYRFACCPSWSLQALWQQDRFLFGNLSLQAARSQGSGSSVGAFVNKQFDRSLTWRDIEWVAGKWGGPLAVKGILRSEDALSAVKSGADTIIVSNHGGRQLDGAASPISCIGAIAQTLGGAASIVCDGGIRRGSHIVKGACGRRDRLFYWTSLSLWARSRR